MATTIQITVDDKGSAKLDQFAGKVRRAGDDVTRESRKMDSAFDRVGHGIVSLNSRMNMLAIGVTSLIGVGGFAGLIAVGKKVLGMSSEQEEVFRKLQTSVELAGGAWMDAKPRIDEYLASMQDLTRFGDTDLAPAMTTIIQLTGDVEKGFEGATIAADLASTGLFNIETASKYVAMAMAGNVEMLGRYIPELRSSAGLITENMSATEKWAMAKELLNKKFGGSAQKDLESYQGWMDSLKNYIGDVAERAGDLISVQLAPKIKEWRDEVKTFIESGKLDEWAEKAAVKIQETVDTLTALGKWIMDHGDLIGNIGVAFLGIGAALQVAGIAVKVTEIVTAIKALNAAAQTGIAAKLFSMGGATAVLGVGAALGFGATMWNALNDAAKEHERAMDNVNTKWDGLLATWVRVNESGDITYIWDKANEKWVANIQILENNAEEADILAYNLEKAGAAAESSGKKISDYYKNMQLRQPDQKDWQLEPVGDKTGDIRGATGELEGMQTAVESVGLELGKVNVFWESFGAQVKDAGSQIYQQITGNLAQALAYGRNLGETFKHIGQQLLAMGLQFAMTAGLNALFPGASIFGGLFHQGGYVRMHTGGIRPDERLALLQAGEFVNRRGSVNAETLPVLASINRTGRAPRGGDTTVNINGDNIVINGSMDRSTVDRVRETVARSRDQLARDIQNLIDTRRLRMA